MAGGWDIIVRTFFADGGLSAGLAKANAGLVQLQRSGPGARAGLRAVEIGARQLAFEAAGLQGGIGQLVRGLAMFGGGSALMLGVVAGIGGAALAYRALTKDTREAAAEQKKLREELHRVAETAREARVPGTQRIATQQEQRTARFAELNRLVDERKELLRATAAAAAARAGISEAGADPMLRSMLASDEKLNELYRERRALGQDIRTERESAVDAAEKEADAQARAADEARRMKLELIEANQATVAIVRATRANIAGFGAFLAARADIEARARLGFQGGGTTPLGLPLPGQSATFANIRRNEPRFVPGEPAQRPSNLMRDLQAFQMMTMAMMMGGRGAGGALSGLGGVLSGASGLSFLGKGAAGVLGPVGFGLGALGTVFSLFDKGEDRRQREMMEELRRIRENTDTRQRPQNVGVHVYVDGQEITDRVMYEIGRATRRDSTPRLPPR